MSISNIGTRIRMARAYAGLSLRQLSKKIGISAQAISKYEKGKTSPTMDTIFKISEVTKLPIDFFYQGECLIDFKKLNIHWKEG